MKINRKSNLQLLKKSLIILGILISFLCCEKENVVHIKDEFKIENKSYNEFLNEPLFTKSILELDKIKNENSKHALSKGENLYDFKIDSTSIKKVIINNKTSYTFLIKRDIKHDYFENLVLQNDSLDNTKAYLFQYYPKNESVKKGKSLSFRGEVKIIPIDLKKIKYHSRVSVCVEITVVYCTFAGYENNQYYDSFHLADESCYAHGSEFLVPIKRSVCYDSSGGGIASFAHLEMDNESSSGGSGKKKEDEVYTSSVTEPNDLTVVIKRVSGILNLSEIEREWLSNQEETTVMDFQLFLETNNRSLESINFLKQTIALELLLKEDLKIQKSGYTPIELSNCCPGNCCPDPSIYGSDPVIMEYGIKPVSLAVDGTFNLLVSSFSLLKSDEWVGKRIRGLMSEIGMEIPLEVDNEHLAAIFKIRKRNGVVIIEYKEGLLREMLDLGLNTLDMISFLTPSKGGGAFLASKIGGISITKLTSHLRKIAITNQKVDDVVGVLNSKAKFILKGTGPNNLVKGHHPLAKSAFKNDKFYDYKKAFSVSADALGGQSVHNAITGQQNKLYSSFAKTGEVLTLEKMANIEIKAMTNVNIPEDIATGWVVKALKDLKDQGVKVITHIPWNGIN